jgi:RHH-type rel operon transcriptional repressor/antitoxin RelB
LIIESGIAEMENYYLAADALERIRKGQEKMLSTPAAKDDNSQNALARAI